MTPKEKAKELVDYHLMILANVYDSLHTIQYMAKQCALKCVDEIIKNFGVGYVQGKFYTSYSAIQYYTEVKEEIKQLK